MKIIAVQKCQLGGRIYDVGETAEFDGPVTERIAHNFIGADGKKIAVAGAKEIAEAKSHVDRPAAETVEDKVAAVLKTMNREQLIAKLDEFGITYKPTNKNDFLAKLLLRAQGAID
ncbi:MAG: hypothetical protein MJZ81_07560 [Bacteroidales bacterium]|nr:hypothetical protein [Bacteroidales bacterium]